MTITLFDKNEHGTVVITTKQLAKDLGVSLRTIQSIITEKGMKLVSYPFQTKGGVQKMACVNEAQATAIKIELQNHSKIAKNGFSTLTIANDLEAWELQKRLDAYKDKRIAELTAENNRQRITIEKQNEIITEQQPMVDSYKRIGDSTGLHSMKEAAKILGIGPNILFSTLRGDGIFFYENGTNLPKEEYKKRGYFTVKEEPYSRNNESCVYSKIYVTAKGLLWLEKRYKPNKEDSAK